MLKKLALIFLFIFTIHSLQSKVLPLKTGRWVLDRYRNVEIDVFEYTYAIKNTNLTQNTLELEDGSLWQVVAITDEAASFFEQKNLVGEGLFFDLWQPGDILIFHKIVNRPSLLAYNVSKDFVLDLQPKKSPSNPQLYISSVTNTNNITYTYEFNEKTNSYQQYQHNNWQTIIGLSDGSVWEDKAGRPLSNWVKGDPIHVSKDTPWRGSNTHILMNFRPNNKAEYKRVGVLRAD